jgi:sporulation protein YqfD
MKIDLKGYNIDNLLSTLHKKKIKVFNLSRTGHNSVNFEILDGDYKKTKRYIANFQVKTALSKMKQFPKFLLGKLGVVLALFLTILFGLFASNYTWQIEIFGTKELSVKDIEQVLDENGVRVGKINLKSSDEIEDILLNRYDRIAQVSVIRHGTTIFINLSEKLVYEAQEFEPIVAKHNGIIKKVNIVTGTTNVKVGDFVNIGDLLVLPFNINSKGEKVDVKPMAEIVAEIFVVCKCEIKKTEQIVVRTGKTLTQYNYKFKNKNIFSSKLKNSFALFEVNVYNENISDVLPLNRDVVVYHELETKDVEVDFEKEKQNLIEKSVEQARQQLPAGKELSEQTQTSIVDNKMFAITTIRILGLIND